MQRQSIQMRGVRVHNLQNINIAIPLRKLTVITGVSGAGKSSLALDTLAAEGQRRYIESFSTSARQYLDRFERPDADHIDGLPPAVTLKQRPAKPTARSTVAKVSEIEDHLRLLFARLGQIVCPGCGKEVREETPEFVASAIQKRGEGTRFQVAIERHKPGEQSTGDWFAELQSNGFSRAVIDGKTQKLAEMSPDRFSQDGLGETPLLIVLDRLIIGKSSEARIRDSLELAFQRGNGTVVLLVELGVTELPPVVDHVIQIDDAPWEIRRFSRQLRCETCQRNFLPLEPRLFSARSPLGACPECQGLGERTVDGVTTPCAACGGRRLCPEALAVQFGGMNIADLLDMTVLAAIELTDAFVKNPPAEPILTRTLLGHLTTRLACLRDIGLGYLPLSRPIRMLAGGEARRVAMTSLVTTRLVNTLFVLDEPTSGLHPHDIAPVLNLLHRLRDARNTVVIVDHDPACLRAADEVIELGPGAGPAGGHVVFQGTPNELEHAENSLTARFFQAESTADQPSGTREPTGWLEIEHLTKHNLRDVSVAFPLGMLCVVTGVSGSGKSTLVRESLFPLLSILLGLKSSMQAIPEDIPQAELSGFEGLDEVLLMDQSPLPRTARGSPVTYLKAFDGLRNLFAETPEARLRNMTPATFSLHNKNGGRCPTCEGRGSVSIDMQFLADVTMTCPDCQGARFQRDVLAAKFRGLSIAEVLELTAGEALPLFRGQPSLQKKLATLKSVGLDYLKLGQPARTLSGGESQRLKLASCLAQRTGRRTLFLLDEPTQGLHTAEIGKLLECLEALLSAGHSLIVIEHHSKVIRAADHVIDLGPGGGPDGGRIVACGPPEAIIANPDSITGRHLKSRHMPNFGQ